MSCAVGQQHFVFDISEEPTGFAAANFLDVVLVFQQGAKCIIYRIRIERHAIQLRQRMRPVDGFRHTGLLEKIHFPEFLDK